MASNTKATIAELFQGLSLSSKEKPENYIFLPGKTNAFQDYAFVSKEKSHHNKTWDKVWELLIAENFRMLKLREGVDFLYLLKFRKDVYDGLGNKVSRQERKEIYDEITEARDPWRAEWLDAYFEKRNDGKFYVLTENKSKAEPLNQNCLMQDKTPGIDLEFWLKNANEQGIPTNKTPKGELYYWHPRNGTVARFVANSDRSFLYCIRYPQFSYSALGVRKVAPLGAGEILNAYRTVAQRYGIKSPEDLQEVLKKYSVIESTIRN